MTTKIKWLLSGWMATLLLMAATVATGIEYPASAERWGVFEIVLTGPSSGNPYVDVSLGATFTQDGVQGGVAKNVTGFYDGGSTYRIRFMPDTLGTWSFTTASSSSLLNAQTGAFTCTAAGAGNHGPMRVRDSYHFQYEDGTPFFQVGTTTYNWMNQTVALQNQTLQTFSQNGFNKARFLIMPKYYDFNQDPPAIWPYEGSPNAWSFDRPIYAFFQNHDQRVRQLRDMGIEADIIICNPYDGWGLSNIKNNQVQMDRYVKYLLARFSAYRNVWWSMANEYQLWSTNDTYWDNLFQLVRDNDPYNHLRSIHNMWQIYDHTKPWVTHASLQEQPPEKTPINFMMSMSRDLRTQYGKPIVWDEVKYEGNLPTVPDYFWGRMTPEEMTMKFWVGTIHGVYVGHSETYMHPENIIWWGKGGVLYGGSPARITFLRQLVEQHVPGQMLEPVAGDTTAAHNGTACYLYYYGTSTATSRYFSLPAGIQYRAYVVDTWNMTKTDVGLRSGSFTLSMPANPYMAALFVQEGTVTPPDETFVKGINFNGAAVTIDGNAWTSYSAALASGLSVSPTPSLWSGSVTPVPSVGSDTAAMLNSVVWRDAPGFGFAQTVANGTYNVYLWVMENYQSNVRSFAVQLEGTTVAGSIGTQTLGTWVKYGPYPATVADGALSVNLVSNFEAPHVSGIAIFSTEAGSAPGQSWEFNTAGNLEGWTAQNQVSGLAVAAGSMDGTITGTDPYLHSPTFSQAASVGQVKVSLKNNTASTSAQLFFLTASDGSWSEAKSKTVAIAANNGAFVEYTFDMSTVAGWAGTITRLRLDPANATGSFGVDYVRIGSGTGGGTVATPTISPNGGTFTNAVSVTLACGTSGASLRYTTDGSTPSPTSGTAYSGAFNVTQSCAVKAIAYLSGMTDSAVASAAFTVDASGGGLGWEFNTAGNLEGWTAINNVSGLGVTGGNLGGTITGGDPCIRSAAFSQSASVNQVTVRLQNSTASTVADLFFLTSTDGSWNGTKSKRITIQANSGFADYVFDMSTVASWAGTITQLRLDPSESVGSFGIDYIRIGAGSGGGTVATPTISPNGGTYTDAVSVTLACGTSGASIRYTTDGSAPSPTSGTVYSGTFNVTQSCTVKALAYLSGMTDSAVASAAFTVSASGAVFVKGINFNGGAVTIDGNVWTSYAAALSSGLSVSPSPTLWSGSVTPSPSVGADGYAMLNSAIWYAAPGFGFSQTIANGSYDVYLWVMENYQSNVRSFAVQLEGTTVTSAIGTQTLGAWVKYGPYPATVADGALSVNLVSNYEAPHVMGMAIFTAATGGSPALSWEFNTSGNTEGWTAQNQISGLAASGGSLNGTITGNDPYMLSATFSQDASANQVTVRLKNSTAGTSAQLFFTTSSDGSWNEAKSKTVTIAANSDFADYTFDMSTVAGWAGTVTRLRLDPAANATGSFQIDYIRVGEGQLMGFGMETLEASAVASRALADDGMAFAPAAGDPNAVPADASADYDGDGTVDDASYDAATGTWLITLSGSAGGQVVVTLGGPGTVPVPADYDGDGLADPAVYDGTTGDWQILLSGAGYEILALDGLLGGEGYTACPADYDGDGLADPAVYSQLLDDWAIMLSSLGYALIPPELDPVDVP